MSRPSRLIGASLGLAALLAAGACADPGTGSGAESATGEGSWSSTDDVGTTVELDARPERIAGLDDVASSPWNLGVEPVATLGQTSAADDVRFAGRDLAGVENVGESYGSIDLEALAAADPSLRLCSDLGVQFVDPGGEGHFRQTASWEQVPRYRSDVILPSLRGAMTPEERATQPTYELLPAAQAGQVHPWEHVGMDHAAQARYVERLAGWLREASGSASARAAPASRERAPEPAARPHRRARSGPARCP
ncbi:ABC-type Fe3+-hydroxamate transport system substrate-binding protein [Geodermatophilus bullaregiensis]|uniref:hypothetical protein n=1 Tax=Geodermatophilus bullaregiensis TaxID=1564160 RepID=UPI001956C9CB|nr:hypothetical protein [Geodermatophilus bullaregiensis]MBM7806373.1 ABC-type Fe3+-hydroxamate transport system substrate-binding protein [Geodermatophilus bullaregiensis]